MHNYFKLLSFMKGHRGAFAFAVSMMFCASFFEAFQLSLAPIVIDIIFTKKQIVVPNELPDFLDALVAWANQLDPLTVLKLFPFILFFGILFKQIFIFLYSYYMNDVSQRIMRDIRMKLYDKIQNLSLDYFGKKRTGELVSRVTYDVGYINNAVSYALTDLCKQTFLLTIYTLFAFTFYRKAALIIFVILPFVGYPLAMIGKRLRKLSAATQEKLADLNSHLIESISGIQLVKAFGTENYESKKFLRNNNDLYKVQMKAIKRNVLISPITEMVGVTCGAIIFYVIGRPVFEGEVSLGIFVFFFACIMSIISPVKKLGNVNALTQQALAANERIYDVLESKVTVSEKPNAQTLPEMKKNIVFDNLDFQYDEQSGIVLKGINLEIKKGELVAVVGPTGVGKTTLVSLIPRFYDPIRGSVKIDGVDLKDVTFESLRSQIGIVTQETFLFNDTVRTNIAYGQEKPRQEDIEEAAKKAFAHRFIVTMPNGYDTVIGDRGFRLSGGEKQRISIARAILRNPPILLLDEATSQLDSESESFVQEALDKLMEGRTVIAIAHRLSTVINADKIVVLDKGSIVGLDSHEKLLKTCPLYKKLHSMQFRTE